MRYYRIDITNPTSGSVRTWSSLVNGKFDPGALDVELDITSSTFAVPSATAASYVKVRGVSLQDIAQASNFNGFDISVYGGMSAGLPLANPQQQGLLASGSIIQCFGNWIGTEQSLDLQIVPYFGAKNLSIQWQAGTAMADVIKATLATAFPSYTADIQISDNLVFNQDITAHYSSLATFAQWVKNTSAAILTPAANGGTGSPALGRAGVDIFVQGKKFIVRDDTTAKQPKQLQFQDLMGQPTWLGPFEIQISTVMRGDIAPLDYLKLPTGAVATTTPQSQSQYRDKSAFQGSFQVQRIRHTGQFRTPQGEAWMSIFDCLVIPPTQSSVAVTEQ